MGSEQKIYSYIKQGKYQINDPTHINSVPIQASEKKDITAAN